jgi:Protein of unknown function (DUF2971)
MIPIVRKDISDEAGIAYYREFIANRTPTERATLDRRLLDEHGYPNNHFKKILREGMELFDQGRKIFQNAIGICCFSETYDNILMWAHYADGHRGFCLEFDTSLPPFSIVRDDKVVQHAEEVKYQPEIPSYDLIELMSGDLETRTKKLSKMLLLTKGECWQYQSEWRICGVSGGASGAFDK